MAEVRFAEGWSRLFDKCGFRSFEDFFGYAAGEGVNKNKRRDVVVISLGQGPNRKEFFMKRFYRPYLKDIFSPVRNFGCYFSQAACEWKNAWMLLGYGIDTYHPVCFGEDKRFGLEVRSFFVSERVEGQPLTDFVSQRWLKLGHLQREGIIISLGRFIRRIHDLGISLPDLYIWHIFIRGEERLNEWDFSVIDLHRMCVNVKSRTRQIENLAALHFSMLERYFGRDSVETLMRAYVGTDLAGEQERFLRWVKRRSRIISRRRKHPHYY